MRFKAGSFIAGKGSDFGMGSHGDRTTRAHCLIIRVHSILLLGAFHPKIRSILLGALQAIEGLCESTDFQTAFQEISDALNGRVHL